ncbi:MAG: hypothetical protein KJ964_12430 [Verrucomicrobia bacterium]|nr:hypothetical protein [Verrucomicrobiota bacterium]MBU1736015.1 hypothetical protein [Verrucomicrobiota bacterium]MBU1856916.1 hypothetical protein [Verrucomicrobiota bacterium]
MEQLLRNPRKARIPEKLSETLKIEKDTTMWKANWEETKQHFRDWWNHNGLVIGMWGAPSSDVPHEHTSAPPDVASVRAIYVDAELRARRNHHRLAQQSFPADVLPMADTDIGPGSLALFLGCEPRFSPETVWFEPCVRDSENPEELPPFQFEESAEWWQVTKATMETCAELSRDKYLVGIPDLVENVDILASLREPQALLMNMIERPEWVEQKVAEINQAWFEAYQWIYDITKLADGSSAYGAFRLWGPGKTAKVQCDASAMFSPDMFQRFVAPRLTEQCQWLDNSMYHLDGTQAICHLDCLLDIEGLDAIEWTPQAGIGGGGNPRWFEMYKRILDAGKSVQVVGASRDEILPLLDAIGGKGVYIMTSFATQHEAATLMKEVESYR